MSANDHKNKSPAPGPSAPPAEDTQQQFTRERRKLRWTALGLLVLILLLLLRLGWLKLGGDDGKVVIPPDYPLITIDPDAKKTNDGQGKFTASQGGGKVALSYSTKLSYDMASGVVGLSFANPSSSTQAMVLQIIVYGGTNETTGKPYAILRIASDRRYKDKDGNKLTDFISIKVRGPLAERCAEFAWKGCKLAASGDFETITFEDEPERQPGFLIKASEVEFLSPRKVEETAQELEDESVREVAA